MSGPEGHTDLCATVNGTGTGQFSPLTGSWSLTSASKSDFELGIYELEITAHVGNLQTAHIFKVELSDPCIIEPLAFADTEEELNETFDISVGESATSIAVPTINCVLPDLTLNVTLDGESIQTFNPYVTFDLDRMTVQIDAVDCNLKFANLPLVVEYSDSRGSITTEFASVSLNQKGCDTDSAT